MDPKKLNPFIISRSKVNEGTGTFLVTAVGVNSSYSRITMAMQTEQEDTPLQKKLNSLADWIAKLGGSAAGECCRVVWTACGRGQQGGLGVECEGFDRKDGGEDEAEMDAHV